MSAMAQRLVISVGTAIVLATLTASVAFAGEKPGTRAAPNPVEQKSDTDAVVPDDIKLNLLIRTSIIALNHANQTGNYTVLQNLGAPAFRAGNDSARLAQIFAALRERHLDLSPILYFTPKLLRAPIVGPDGLLRMAGFFPTSPERVNFELVFQQIDGQWRIFGIGVTTSRADATAALSSSSPAAKPPQAEVRDVPLPIKNTASPRRRTSAKQGSSTVGGASENGSVRIDFAAPQASSRE